MDKLQWIPKYNKNWDPVLECPACGYWRAGYDTTNLFYRNIASVAESSSIECFLLALKYGRFNYETFKL